jgi:hypothetical protein
MVTNKVAATAKTPKLSFLRVFKVLVMLTPYINQVKFTKTRDKPRMN